MKKKLGYDDGVLLIKKLKNVFQLVANAVKSVNGIEADETGDITVRTVPFAQNLESESSQRSYGTFIQRMSGGGSSVEDGSAWLLGVKGNNIHTGFQPESLTMTVDATGETPITAVLNRDTFVSAVSESGTIVLTYSSGWSTDPDIYGITITGEPSDGDEITIVYVKEERGTIIPANPQSFVATGWNLFKYVNGSSDYARVCKYANGYRIEGAYTSLQFSATFDGARSEIVVTDGNFDVPEDGYVWVNGGNSSTTAIYATWEDWTEDYEGDFEAYTESVVDLSSIMSSEFPYGLLKAGSVVDEIDLNLAQAISRVERMAYNETNLVIAQTSGREYEYDDNYIYLARSTPTVSSISVDGAFSVNDHGIEFFDQSGAPTQAEILYGNNLKNKLERDVLTKSAQSLSAAEKAQARSNIGAITNDDVLCSWGSRQTIKEIKNGSTTVAYLYGRINTKAKLGWIHLVGNANTPQGSGTTISVTLPEEFVPAYSSIIALKDGKYMEIRTDGKANIVFNGIAYAGASIVYPLG